MAYVELPEDRVERPCPGLDLRMGIGETFPGWTRPRQGEWTGTGEPELVPRFRFLQSSAGGALAEVVVVGNGQPDRGQPRKHIAKTNRA